LNHGKEGAMNQSTNQSKATRMPSQQKAVAASGASSTATARLAHADIAKRAYEIYLNKGCPEGQSERIWLQAEQELLKKLAVATAANRPASALPGGRSYPAASH
jgi:hypothetical protein